MNTDTRNVSDIPATLTFDGVTLRILGRDGLPWISSGDLGRALGYKREGDQVASIYRQHADEFCGAMTSTITLGEFNAESAVNSRAGNPNVPVRIFSPRGAHLIAMFARTAKAAAFRRWVLDVLEGVTCPEPPTPPALQLMQTRVLMSYDGEGKPSAKALPADAAIVTGRDFAAWAADPFVIGDDALSGVALAALQRIRAKGGASAVQAVLRGLDADFLLVNESELMYSLYRSRLPLEAHR